MNHRVNYTELEEGNVVLIWKGERKGKLLEEKALIIHNFEVNELIKYSTTVFNSGYNGIYSGIVDFEWVGDVEEKFKYLIVILRSLDSDHIIKREYTAEPNGTITVKPISNIYLKGTEDHDNYDAQLNEKGL